MTFRKAASLADIWEGELTQVVVDGRKVLLVRFGDDVHAYEDRCAHLGVELSRGRLEGRVLVCQAHEWTYDAESGRGINPAKACLKRFAVEIVGGLIMVDVGSEGKG